MAVAPAALCCKTQCQSNQQQTRKMLVPPWRSKLQKQTKCYKYGSTVSKQLQQFLVSHIVKDRFSYFLILSGPASDVKRYSMSFYTHWATSIPSCYLRGTSTSVSFGSTSRRKGANTAAGSGPRESQNFGAGSTSPCMVWNSTPGQS